MNEQAWKILLYRGKTLFGSLGPYVGPRAKQRAETDRNEIRVDPYWASTNTTTKLIRVRSNPVLVQNQDSDSRNPMYKIYAKTQVAIVGEFGPFSSLVAAKKEAQKIADNMAHKKDVQVMVLDKKGMKKLDGSPMGRAHRDLSFAPVDGGFYDEDFRKSLGEDYNSADVLDYEAEIDKEMEEYPADRDDAKINELRDLLEMTNGERRTLKERTEGGTISLKQQDDAFKAAPLINPLRLGKKDKATIRDFTFRREDWGTKLHSSGKELNGNWMGGRGIAFWDGDKIYFTDLGSKAAETVQRYLKKQIPKNDFGGFKQVPSWSGSGTLYRNPSFKQTLNAAADVLNRKAGQFGAYVDKKDLERCVKRVVGGRLENPGHDWIGEADQEMEYDGTEGAFTKQARRAGYKNTMEFARKVMAGWRSGKKTVLNKKTRKKQGITKKTMARANFAINAQKRRRNPDIYDAERLVELENVWGPFVPFPGLQFRDNATNAEVIEVLGPTVIYKYTVGPDAWGDPVKQYQASPMRWKADAKPIQGLSRRNPKSLSFSFDTTGGRNGGTVTFRRGPVGKVGSIAVSVLPNNPFYAYLYEDAPNWVLMRDYIYVIRTDDSQGTRKEVPYATKVKVWKAAQKALEIETGLPPTPRALPKRRSNPAHGPDEHYGFVVGKLPSEYLAGKPAHDADFIAGYLAGENALQSTRDITITDIKAAYRQVDSKYGSWWIDGFRTAVEIDMGIATTHSKLIAQSLGLIGGPSKPARQNPPLKTPSIFDLVEIYKWGMGGPETLWLAPGGRMSTSTIDSNEAGTALDVLSEYGIDFDAVDWTTMGDGKVSFPSVSHHRAYTINLRLIPGTYHSGPRMRHQNPAPGRKVGKVGNVAIYKNEYDEYVVVQAGTGPESWYHTDDKNDAEQTAERMFLGS